MFPVGRAATIAELTAGPHPLLARLRATEPVSWLPELDGWLVTRYDLAVRVMRDAATFTVDDPRFSTAQVVGPSMLSLDGAEHARHRAAFAGYFRPREVADRYDAFVAARTRELVDRLRPAGRAELRRELAGPLAVAVMAWSLGLPGDATDRMLGWYDAIVAAVDDISAGRQPGPAADAAVGELRGSVTTSVEYGRSALLTEAATALDLPEVFSNAAVLMFGGIETTEGMTANVVAHLLGHPDQLALVERDRSLVPVAVEESLRLEPAAAVVDRYAVRDVALGDARIRQGDLVRVSLTGANRDPAVFGDPDTFDVRRTNLRQQLAFAHGPHFCVAADLARLQARTVVETVLDRLPGLRLDSPAVPRGLVFRKPTAVNVRWRPDTDRG
ncbi:MAG TPA: cytochrome P450 [Pseudonocardiaceae bacterium]|nr:cytochrome P450 [Pseudonocardiaceae bacterium]